MNLREGTRRLALLLGALGIIAGGFASYVELQTVLPQRAAHDHFEQLANSEVVKQERMTLQGAPAFIPDPSTKIAKGVVPVKPDSGGFTIEDAPPAVRPGTAHPELEGTAPETLPGDFFDKQDAGAKKAPPAKDVVPVKPGSGDDPFAAIAQPVASEVRKDGIETINWSHDYGVASIETEDGHTLYPTPAPSAWLYLLIALFPILGFFIPWGAIRAIVWVGEGFVNPAK